MSDTSERRLNVCRKRKARFCVDYYTSDLHEVAKCKACYQPKDTPEMEAKIALVKALLDNAWEAHYKATQEYWYKYYEDRPNNRET